MALELVETPAETKAPPRRISHLFCNLCRTPDGDTMAMCGHRKINPRFGGLPPHLVDKCVVCTDLMFSACPRCGTSPEL